MNCRSSTLHKQPGERETPVPAKARPGLHRGGWAGTHHSRMRDRHHAHHCASTISHRSAGVPSSTHSAPYVSPVGINQEAHRIDSRIPLGPRTPSSKAPDRYPHGMPNIPNGGGTSPRISPSPLAGPLMAPLSVSSRGGSRPLNRWGQAARRDNRCYGTVFHSCLT